MRKVGILILSITLFSCGTAKNQVDEIIEEEVVAEAPPPVSEEITVPVESEIGSFEESDPIDIDSAYIIGNKMFIHVKYGGGCKDHIFKMIGSPMVMKSLPPKRSIQLYHKNNDDMCKAIVMKVLEIDLKNLAYQQQTDSEIVFILKNYKNELKYTYQ